MKKFEIAIDACAAYICKCFHKIVVTKDKLSAEKVAERWMDLLICEVGDEFDEFSIEVVEEYTGTEHEVGDCWEEEIKTEY